jgi:asparagine synthase (glutamine-hydrolysing)
MPGICGFISRRRIEDAAAVLAPMVGRLRSFDWQQVQQWTSPSGRYAIGRVHLGVVESQPATFARVVHGEEFDAFTCVEYDEANQTLTIRGDVFGMMPLFYAETDDGLVFATELKSVAAHVDIDVQLDERGLADLLAFGFLLGEKTLLKGVRCRNGGTRLIYDARTGELRKESTWSFAEQLGQAATTTRAMRQRVEESFVAAVERCMTGEACVGVSLSGGYDSRTLLAAIDHRRHRVRTLTLDVPGGADQMIAERIARAAHGIENHTFVENSERFFERWPDYVQEMVWLSDGMFFDEACVMMPTLDIYRELGVGVVLRGHGGELARMHEAYELRCNRHVMACRTQPELKRQMLRQMRFGMSEQGMATYLVPKLAERVRGAAEASMEEAFAGIDVSWSIVDQVSCLYLQEYLRRQCVPSLNLLRSRVETRLPFLDRDYVGAVLALPPQIRVTTQVHRRLLKRCAPALLSITNANNGASAGASDLRQRISRKLTQWLRVYLGYDQYRHYVDVPGWLRGKLRSPVEEILLDERVASRGLVQIAAVQQAMADHATGRGNRATALLQLAYIELWHRQTMDKGLDCKVLNKAIVAA